MISRQPKSRCESELQPIHETFFEENVSNRGEWTRAQFDSRRSSLVHYPITFCFSRVTTVNTVYYPNLQTKTHFSQGFEGRLLLRHDLRAFHHADGGVGATQCYREGREATLSQGYAVFFIWMLVSHISAKVEVL